MASDEEVEEISRMIHHAILIHTPLWDRIVLGDRVAVALSSENHTGESEAFVREFSIWSKGWQALLRRG